MKRQYDPMDDPNSESYVPPENISIKVWNIEADSVRRFCREMQMPKSLLIRNALKEYLEKRGYFFE